MPFCLPFFLLVDKYLAGGGQIVAGADAHGLDAAQDAVGGVQSNVLRRFPLDLGGARAEHLTASAAAAAAAAVASLGRPVAVRRRRLARLERRVPLRCAQ